MAYAPKTPFVFVLVAVPLLAIGCSGKKAGGDPEVQRRKSELGELYEVYMMYSKRNQRPPKQLSDLNKSDYQAIYPMGLKAVQEGQYIVVWGTSVGSKSKVLAYEKDAPKQGGTVLMADGTVKNMSADDLQAALKAGR